MSFGSDFSGIDDIDQFWTFLEGEEAEVTACIQAVARRYMVPRGGNPWDNGYGYDLRLLVGSSADPAIAETQISAEARKEERIAECIAKVTVSGPTSGETWTIVIKCTMDNGLTFTLTLAVTAVTVVLLNTGR